MSRETIEIPWKVERLQVLDADGNFDEELSPELDDDELLAIHRAMVFARRFDAKQLQLQRQGRIGTFAPVKGQEAAQIGSASVLREKDWMVPAFREIAASLWRGLDPSALIVYNGGYNEGAALPDDAHDLPIAIPVATQIPHAVGLGYAIKLREADEIVMTYFGDGATSEGDFHEAMNFAALYDLPVVFVCQNNQWAISTPLDKQTPTKTLAQKAIAYGMPGVQVDGNDVLAVRRASEEAAERARKGEGPTFIEAVTYRLGVHTTVDDPSKYRDEEEVEEWKQRDPIDRLREHLKGRQLIDDDAIDELEKEVEAEVDEAWEKAEKTMASLGDPVDMFDHLFAEPTAELDAQRAEVEARSPEKGAPEQKDDDDEEQEESDDASEDREEED